MKCSSLTDVGLVRKLNEDCFLADLNLYLFGVADGMGGHQAGEVASALAIETTKEVFASDHGVQGAGLLLKRALEQANQVIYAQAAESESLRGMGTTVTLGKIEDNLLTLCHVGDSRCYLYRAGELKVLTYDHSFVGELVTSGVITEAEARVHPQRNILTRAVGTSACLEVDFYEYELEPGDKLLWCTDGLYGVVPEELLAQTLAAGQGVERMLELALAAGGPDNITMVLVEEILQ